MTTARSLFGYFCTNKEIQSNRKLYDFLREERDRERSKTMASTNHSIEQKEASFAHSFITITKYHGRNADTLSFLFTIFFTRNYTSKQIYN